MMKQFLQATQLILLIALTSCCTVVTHPQRTVLITAAQEDTEITIDGFPCGPAPFFVDLDKRHNHTITCMKEGYPQQDFFLRSQHTSKVAFNLAAPVTGAVVGGTIGFITLMPIPYPPLWVAGAISGAETGLIVGSGIGAASAIADHSLRSDCELHTEEVHFNLIQ